MELSTRYFVLRARQCSTLCARSHRLPRQLRTSYSPVSNPPSRAPETPFMVKVRELSSQKFWPRGGSLSEKDGTAMSANLALRCMTRVRESVVWSGKRTRISPNCHGTPCQDNAEEFRLVS